LLAGLASSKGKGMAMASLNRASKSRDVSLKPEFGFELTGYQGLKIRS
jgi:hypothetical protein